MGDVWYLYVLLAAGHWQRVESHMAELKKREVQTDYVMYSTLITALGVKVGSRDQKGVVKDTVEQLTDPAASHQ